MTIYQDPWLISNKQSLLKPWKVIFFINPFSCAGKALDCWNQIKHLCECANFETTEFITTYQNQAKEWAFTEDIYQYDQIISVSGDGLVHEIVQGMYAWKDFDLEKMPPIGIIPGGSGDALAKTLLFDSIEHFSIENAFWLIVKG